MRHTYVWEVWYPIYYIDDTILGISFRDTFYLELSWRINVRELTAKDLKAHPVPGHYRWKYGKGVLYHSGIAHIYCKRGTWFCDTL